MYHQDETWIQIVPIPVGTVVEYGDDNRQSKIVGMNDNGYVLEDGSVRQPSEFKRVHYKVPPRTKWR